MDSLSGHLKYNGGSILYGKFGTKIFVLSVREQSEEDRASLSTSSATALNVSLTDASSQIPVDRRDIVLEVVSESADLSISTELVFAMVSLGNLIVNSFSSQVTKAGRLIHRDSIGETGRSAVSGNLVSNLGPRTSSVHAFADKTFNIVGLIHIKGADLRVSLFDTMQDNHWLEMSVSSYEASYDQR